MIKDTRRRAPKGRSSATHPQNTTLSRRCQGVVDNFRTVNLIQPQSIPARRAAQRAAIFRRLMKSATRSPGGPSGAAGAGGGGGEKPPTTGAPIRTVSRGRGAAQGGQQAAHSAPRDRGPAAGNTPATTDAEAPRRGAPGGPAGLRRARAQDGNQRQAQRSKGDRTGSPPPERMPAATDHGTPRSGRKPRRATGGNATRRRGRARPEGPQGPEAAHKGRDGPSPARPRAHRKSPEDGATRRRKGQAARVGPEPIRRAAPGPGAQSPGPQARGCRPSGPTVPAALSSGNGSPDRGEVVRPTRVSGRGGRSGRHDRGPLT